MIPKFRCFVGNKKMFDVEAIDFAEQEVQVPIFDKETGEYLASAGLAFDDIILMQSTGLFDKNGVEIFEGDVVEVYGEKSLKVFFSHGAFCIDFLTNGTPLHAFGQNQLEVIGNIHEHPNLVEGGG